MLHTLVIPPSISAQSSKNPVDMDKGAASAAMNHMVDHSDGDRHVNKEAPSWTLRCDPGDVLYAKRLVSHLVEGLKITPLDAILSLMRDCVLEQDGVFVCLPANRKVNWEATMIDTAELSAPLLLWHLLLFPPYRTHMAFAFSLMHKEPTNIFGASIPYVCEWYRHVVYNPPFVDSALRFGRGCVQEVIGFGADQLRRVYRSFGEYNHELTMAIEDTWNLKAVSPFTASVSDCIVSAPIPIQVVVLDKSASADITIESSVGLIMANRHCHDKTVVS